MFYAVYRMRCVMLRFMVHVLHCTVLTVLMLYYILDARVGLLLYFLELLSFQITSLGFSTEYNTFYIASSPESPVGKASYCNALYCTVLYCIALHCIELYCTLSHALKNTANKRQGLPLHILRYARRVICNG